RALALHPDDFSILSPYVDCANILGRQDLVERGLVRAREILLERVARRPDDRSARGHLANVLTQSGDTAAGLAQVELLLADPNLDGPTTYNLACALCHAGQLDRAMDMLRRLLELSPGYYRDWAVKDPDLAPLHERADFIALFGRAG